MPVSNSLLPDEPFEKIHSWFLSLRLFQAYVIENGQLIGVPLSPSLSLSLSLSLPPSLSLSLSLCVCVCVCVYWLVPVCAGFVQVVSL